MDINPLSDDWCENIFSQSVRYSGLSYRRYFYIQFSDVGTFFFPGMWDPKYYSRSPGILSARLSSSVLGSVVCLGWGASTMALPGADTWEHSISGTKLGFLSMKDMDSWPLCPPVLSFSSIFLVSDHICCLSHLTNKLHHLEWSSPVSESSHLKSYLYLTVNHLLDLCFVLFVFNFLSSCWLDFTRGR